MVDTPRHNLFATSGWHIIQITLLLYKLTSSSEWRQERLGCPKGTGPKTIGKRMIPKKANCGEMRGNEHCKEWRDSVTATGYCGYRNHCNNKLSWRNRDGDQAQVGQYEKCYKAEIENQKGRKRMLGLVLATGPGNPPVVRVWTEYPVVFCSRTVY